MDALLNTQLLVRNSNINCIAISHFVNQADWSNTFVCVSTTTIYWSSFIGCLFQDIYKKTNKHKERPKCKLKAEAWWHLAHILYVYTWWSALYNWPASGRFGRIIVPLFPERQEAEDGNRSTRSTCSVSMVHQPHIPTALWGASRFLLLLIPPSFQNHTRFDIHHKHQHKYWVHTFPLKIKKLKMQKS